MHKLSHCQSYCYPGSFWAQTQIKGRAASVSNTEKLRTFLQMFPFLKQKLEHNGFSLLSICYYKKSPDKASVWRRHSPCTTHSLTLDVVLSSSSRTLPPSSPLNENHCNSSSAQEMVTRLFFDSMTVQTLLQRFLLPPTVALSSLQESSHLAFCALCRNHPPPSSPVTSTAPIQTHIPSNWKLSQGLEVQAKENLSGRKLLLLAIEWSHVQLYILNYK